MPQSIFILCNIKYTYYIPTFLLFNYMYKIYIYNYYRKMNGLGFCESNEKYSILKKLVNYINLDPTINDSDKKNIEINKLKKVLGLGCDDTLNKILKGQTQPQPQTQPQTQTQTQTPQQTPPQTPPQARSPWYSSYMFLTNPTKQPDKREHSEFDIDRLSIEIEGLQHLNSSGEHTLTYYKFFEKNNLLSDKYLGLYFKLTGVLHMWSDGYATYNKPLDCTKVIKLVKNDGNFSLINKYNTCNDYRKIDQQMDGAKFNLYAKTAELQGEPYYYDKINISKIYTSTLINLNNNTDKRQQEKEKEKEEEQEIIFNDKDLSEAYDKYNPPITSSLGGKRKSKGKSNKVAKKPVVSQKKQSIYKEIFGKQMKIYKMPDSRKEYVKYKGELHPISEYKSLMKQKTMAKPKPKAKAKK